MSAPCPGCGAVVDCPDGLNNPDGFDYQYTLTGDPTLPFFFYCPSGYNCRPVSGSGPIYLNCCGHVLSATVESTTTDAELTVIIQGMIAQCQQYAGECANPPTLPKLPVSIFFNLPQVVSGSCMSAGGITSTFTSTAPSGMFFGFDQATANAAAAAYAQHNYRQPCCAQSPRMQGNPGWCCLGADLDADPEANTYLVTGPSSTSDFTFDVTGTLPPGTTLDKATHNSAILGGVPTTPGFYTYTVKATRTDLPTIYTSVTDTFAVFGITNPTGSGTVGAAFSQQLATGGGTLPVTFSATPADLPAGLTMDSTGLITGTPTGATSTPFNVTITDADGGVCVQAVTIAVTGGGTINWSTLSWGSFYNTCTPGPPYSAPTGTFSGASFTAAADGAGDVTCNDPAGPSGTFCDGTLTYNGPAVNGNILLAATFGGIPGQARVDVEIYQDGSPVVTATIISGGTSPITVPFTIADTGGLPSAIKVTVDWFGGVAGNGLFEGIVNATGSIS